VYVNSKAGRSRADKQTSSDLETKVASLTSELDTARETSSTSTKEVEDLRANHEQLTTTHASLQEEHTKLQTTLDTLRNEHDTLQTTHAASSTTLKELETKLQTAQTELSTTKTTLAGMTKRAETAEKRKEALQTENDELVTQLEEVRGRVVEVMGEKAELAGRIETLETRSKNDAKDLEAAKNQIAEHESTMSTLRDTSISDERALEISQQAAKIRELEAALHAATSRVHSLTKQLSAAPLTSPSQNLFLESKTPPVQRIPSVDLMLPASVRHKRQASLAGLKARMGPSRTVSGLGPMESVQEDLGLIGRKQFGDEIMFCCPACEGDLITL
jgi:chromosome segregation ATPase